MNMQILMWNEWKSKYLCEMNEYVNIDVEWMDM